jgi:hypothetical protein
LELENTDESQKGILVLLEKRLVSLVAAELERQLVALTVEVVAKQLVSRVESGV